MRIIALLLCVFAFCPYSFSKNEQKKSNNLVEEYTENEFEQIKISRLKRLHRELVLLRNEINRLKKEDSDDLDMVTRATLDSNISKLVEQYEKKRYLFIETVTNVNLGGDFQRKDEQGFTHDIKQILAPALNSFKAISERPRKIQQLKKQLEALQLRYADALKAKERLNQFLEKGDVKILKWKLKESIKLTDKLIKSLKVKLEDLQFKIIKIEKSEKSIVSTFSHILFQFITTKGKNLLLSLLAFLVFFWIFKFGQGKIMGLILIRVNRLENKEMYLWILRPVRIIYNVVASLISFFMAILTLYVLNDWVLVTFILFLFAALIWSSRQYLPIFLEQSKIVLNLGSVREGERVMYHDLPWRIEGLGYYCKLVNPELSGGVLRVNTKELVNAHSRRSIKTEPWFPSSVGDWVIIDNHFCQVQLQSPEQVILEKVGGELLYYQAKSFYQACPINLNQGFGIEVIFGVDYSLQTRLFSEVIPQIDQMVQEQLEELYPNADFEIKTDFHHAGASSLDIRIFLKCSGTFSRFKLQLERQLQMILVKVCNTYDYNIPFNQITVHTEGIKNSQ